MRQARGQQRGPPAVGALRAAPGLPPAEHLQAGAAHRRLPEMARGPVPWGGGSAPAQTTRNTRLRSVAPDPHRKQRATPVRDRSECDGCTARSGARSCALQAPRSFAGQLRVLPLCGDCDGSMGSPSRVRLPGIPRLGRFRHKHGVLGGAAFRRELEFDVSSRSGVRLGTKSPALASVPNPRHQPPLHAGTPTAPWAIGDRPPVENARKAHPRLLCVSLYSFRT